MHLIKLAVLNQLTANRQIQTYIYALVINIGEITMMTVSAKYLQHLCRQQYICIYLHTHLLAIKDLQLETEC